MNILITNHVYYFLFFVRNCSYTLVSSQTAIMSTKAKAPKASDIPFEDNGKRYVVEPATSGRSSCKRVSSLNPNGFISNGLELFIASSHPFPFSQCKEKIEKGALRFGSSAEGAMHGAWFWHHLECASSGQVSNCMGTYADLASVPYYSNLSEDNKTAVREEFGNEE